MTRLEFHGGAAKPGLADVGRYPFPGLSIPSGFQWTANGQLLYLSSAERSMVNGLWRLDPVSLERTLLLGAQAGRIEDESLEEALLKERQRQRGDGITRFELVPDSPWALVPRGRELSLVHSETGEVQDIPLGEAQALDPQVSPDGASLAYVQDGELWVRGLFEGAPLQLTRGDPGRTRGLAEFIAQEEMGRSAGFFWSPDGRSIAFLEVDERAIPEYPIVHQGKDQVAVEHHRYPFPGQTNARVRLGVVAIDSPESLKWLELGEDGLEYIARVAWFHDGHLAVQVQDRRQSRLVLLDVDPSSGAIKRLIQEEAKGAWINLNDGFRALPDGAFLWLSEASGFQHLQLRDRDGQLIRALTSGDWLVTELLSVDAERREAYVRVTEGSPLDRQVLRLGFDGSRAPCSEGPGWHSRVQEPGGSRAITITSRPQSPPRFWLEKGEGERVLLFDGAHEDARCAALRPPEIVSLPGEPTLYGAFYRADEAFAGPRPLVVHVYGGPHAQRVMRDWSVTVDMRAQLLTGRGFHVLRLDNRGSANRGLAFEAALRHDMGRVEIEDQVRGVRFFVERGEVDPARVGICGWSYGGYMTCMALMRAPDTFKAGVAGASVTHWDGYDTHYTERYMGLPEDNAEGYRVSSALAQVSALRGRLLLIHGLIDENVHFRHTARLINALIAADKDYDLLLFPDERHMPRREQGRIYMERKILEYFEAHL